MGQAGYERTLTLLAKDTDFTGRWRPGAIFIAAQETAEEHVNQLGYGYFKLRERNLAWILTRMEVEMEQYPHIGDTIKIITMPGKMRHSVFPRYFEFRDSSGKRLGRAVSLWVLLDMEQRTMVSAEQAGISVVSESEEFDTMALPPTPRTVVTEHTKQSTRVPVYTDFDTNQHVNNTKYIDWLCDLFPVDRFKTASFAHLLIGYAHEIPIHEELTLVFTDEETSFSLTDQPGGKAHFTVCGEWGEFV